MWKYEKKLQYPVNIKKRDLNLAKCILVQYGGPAGDVFAIVRHKNNCLNGTISVINFSTQLLCTLFFEIQNSNIKLE